MRIAKYILLLSCLSAPAVAQETHDAQPQDPGTKTQAEFIAGADYITGRFNGQSYETQSASAGVAISRGRFSLSASLPYVITTAPEDLIVSQGGLLGTPILATPTTRPAQVRREGIGDLSLQAGYRFPLSGLDAAIAGTVKVPTASRQAGLGTGELDYGVTGQLSKRTGSFIPFVSASYSVIGKPQGFDVRNTLAGTAGGQLLLGKSSALSLSYSYEQSAAIGIDDRQSIGVGLRTRLSQGLSLGMNGSAGLSSGAPDAHIGLRLGLGF